MHVGQWLIARERKLCHGRDVQSAEDIAGHNESMQVSIKTQSDHMEENERQAKTKACLLEIQNDWFAQGGILIHSIHVFET